MKNYYRVILGKGGKYADQCFTGGFVGLYSNLQQDLGNDDSADLREFRLKWVPRLIKSDTKLTKAGAGIACGYLYSIAKGMAIGDIVISPDGKGSYIVGEVIGDYCFISDELLNHRRTISWHSDRIERTSMSEALKRLTGVPHTVVQITKMADEIEKLLSSPLSQSCDQNDEQVEDPVSFMMESHLEDFLVQNWARTELGQRYDIYEMDGELVGQQFPTDTGPMDILAVSKDKTELLVVELKRGRASDRVVGQILRYMGFVKAELAEKNQIVKGAIIALDDDLRIRRSIEAAQVIELYRYEVSFNLHKVC